MTEDQRLAITQVAQNGVDEILKQCRENGVEPISALEGAILSCQETIHWAEEAIAQIRKGQK